MNKFYLVFLILLLSGCNSQPGNSFIRTSIENITISPGQSLLVKADFQQDVNFQGQFNYDDIDIKSGNVTYSADSGGAFLAGIIAHAITADATKNMAMSSVQIKANTVLNPYNKYLQQFENDELVSCVLNSVNDNYDFNVIKYTNDKASSGLVLKSAPIFYMTQDERQLILTHAMYIYRSDKPEVILHKNIIEITSEKTHENNQLHYWIAKNNLPIISSELYARSVELFIDDMLGVYDKTPNKKQKTFRYTQGGIKNYERGSLVNNECGNTTMRTLRGWIKSYPNEMPVNADNKCIKKSYIDNNSKLVFSEIQ